MKPPRRVEQLLNLLEEPTALVPALLIWEVANVLPVAVRRQRLSQAERSLGVELLFA